LAKPPLSIGSLQASMEERGVRQEARLERVPTLWRRMDAGVVAAGEEEREPAAVICVGREELRAGGGDVDRVLVRGVEGADVSEEVRAQPAGGLSDDEAREEGE
jgi:hypothetical protein